MPESKLTTPYHLEQLIDLAIEFLARRQLPYGEFKVFACNNDNLEGDSFFNSSPFATTFITHSLCFIKQSITEYMIRQALSFISREMIGPGLFQYYGARSMQKLQCDLDDTACASFALRNTHPIILMHYNIKDILHQRDDHGRFYTWFGLDPKINDIDSVVNANVICYLGDCKETELACKWLFDIIYLNREASSYHYYLNDITLYYTISRAYNNGAKQLFKVRDLIIRKILRLQKTNGSFGDELASGLAISTLINFHYWDADILDRAINYLCFKQQTNGSWKSCAMYCGSGLYYGSEELTTGFCLEALARSIS